VTDILPCPFCGGLDAAAHEEAGLHMVACFMCGCYGPASPNPESAMRMWNTRTFSAGVQAIPDCSEGVK